MLEKICYNYDPNIVYIYQITFEGTNNAYIGSTVNPRQRMLQHFSDLKHNKHGNIILQRTFLKYKNFNFKIIFKCNVINRNKVEEWFINKSSYNSNYNIATNCKQPIIIYKTNKMLIKEDIINIFKLVNLGFQLNRIAKLYNCSKEQIKSILIKKLYKYESKDLLFDFNLFNLNKSINKKNNFIELESFDIYMYDINGNYINKFNSTLEINIKYNLNRSSIINSLNRGIQLKGFIFSKTPINFKEYIPNKRLNYIFVFDKYFNLISKFSNMSECSKYYNLSLNCINSNCNRLNKNSTLSYYFIREKDLNNFKIKYNI